MTYAYEGGVGTENKPGALKITAQQYDDAIDAMLSGKQVTIAGGVLAFVDVPVDATEDEMDPLARTVTRKQLRLTLVRNGITLASVESAIDAIPDDLQKAEAQIEWADGDVFSRHDPLLISIATQLGIVDEDIDRMWIEALQA